ncbi:MAG: phosphate signaling complex protein PhoU [Magnetococcales bacterium]|nr:phosphate signaling complex protein PhoU [Magnetococcales bacterium]
MPIYEKRLQQDLNQIRQAVADMGAGVENALKNAVQSLLSGNEALANMTILMDEPLDRHCQHVDQMCHGFIARHLPSAGHLRLISSSLRMIYELERIADYAVNICRESLDLETPPSGVLRQELESMANASRNMLHQALSAFNQENAGLAKSTMELNAQLGKGLEQAIRDLVAEGDSHAGHSRDIVDLYVIFTMLERVGNRATNLCEEVVFWLTGEMPPTKVINVLFLDEENNALGLMAQAMASKGYEKSCQFSSAGRNPAKAPDPRAVEFMRGIGIDISALQPTGLAQVDLDAIDVIIALQGRVRSYIPKPPFHAAFLDWDVGALPEANEERNSANRRYEEIYRDLAGQLRELMDILAGREVM